MYDVPVIPGAVQGGWIGLHGQNGPITEGGGRNVFYHYTIVFLLWIVLRRKAVTQVTYSIVSPECAVTQFVQLINSSSRDIFQISMRFSGSQNNRTVRKCQGHSADLHYVKPFGSRSGD